MVTSIKFSPDYKYFITGDAEGVIHHYQKTGSEDVYEYASSAMASSSMKESESKFFPYHLKVRLSLLF